MDEKQAALVILKKFINSPDKLFILKGKAGTGKTTIITKLFTEPEFINKKIVLSAPTNKAVSVLKKMLQEKYSNIDFKTIHKLCKIKRRINTHNGDIVFNFNECPNDPKCSIYSYDIIVIDEASMINKEIFIMLVNLSKKIKGKIIFVGDVSQLPPINEPLSKVFEPVINKDIPSFTLNEIVRYKNNIQVFSDRIIKNINSDVHISLKGIKDDSLIIFKEDEGWLDRYVGNMNIDNIVLAFTNDRCRELNYKIRHKYFKKCKAEYIKTEIIVFNNFYKSFVENTANTANTANTPPNTSNYTSQKAIIEDLESVEYQIRGLNNQYFIDISQNIAKVDNLKPYMKLDEAILCPICLDEDINDNILETPCNHKYCEKCIKMWMVENECCPFCRMEITEDKLIIDNDIVLSNKLFEIIKFTRNLTYFIWKIRLQGRENEYINVIKKSNIQKYNSEMEQFKKMIIDIKNYIVMKTKISKRNNGFLVKRLWEYYYYNIKDVFADISYGYCLTVHKSQGSTYLDAYVDSRNILSSPKKFKQHLKCLYTAVTRPSNRLCLLI